MGLHSVEVQRSWCVSSVSQGEDVALLVHRCLSRDEVVPLVQKTSCNSWKGSRVGGCAAVASLVQFNGAKHIVDFCMVRQTKSFQDLGGELCRIVAEPSVLP